MHPEVWTYKQKLAQTNAKNCFATDFAEDDAIQLNTIYYITNLLIYDNASEIGFKFQKNDEMKNTILMWRLWNQSNE